MSSLDDSLSPVPDAVGDPTDPEQAAAARDAVDDPRTDDTAGAPAFELGLEVPEADAVEQAQGVPLGDDDR